MMPLPFGAYAPNELQAACIAIMRRMPDGWLGRRIAYALRRLVIYSVGENPLDVETFDLRLRLYGYDNVAEKRLLYTPQFFDRQERELIAAMLKDGGAFVDVGANAGGYSLYVASTNPTAKILAVEPQPEMLARLHYNVAENGLSQIQIVAAALSDHEGEMTLHTYSHNRGEASLKPGMDLHPATGQVQVRVLSLLQALKEAKLEAVDIMKLDAEGAEDSILSSFFSHAPAALHPHMILLEYVPSRWSNDLRKLLITQGYRLDTQTHLNAVFIRSAS